MGVFSRLAKNISQTTIGAFSKKSVKVAKNLAGSSVKTTPSLTGGTKAITGGTSLPRTMARNFAKGSTGTMQVLGKTVQQTARPVVLTGLAAGAGYGAVGLFGAYKTETAITDEQRQAATTLDLLGSETDKLRDRYELEYDYAKKQAELQAGLAAGTTPPATESPGYGFPSVTSGLSPGLSPRGGAEEQGGISPFVAIAGIAAIAGVGYYLYKKRKK